jgi:N-acetylglucosamine-6-phosphate deacetylase
MSSPPKLIRLTNCRVAHGDDLQRRDLWVSSATGRIEDAQAAFFSDNSTPVETINLGGRIVAPGFIDVQINGSFGFDFSTPSRGYAVELAKMNRELVKTGVTSYLPTLPSQSKDVYEKVCELS